MEYIRKQFNTLKERILEPRKFMQVVAGSSRIWYERLKVITLPRELVMMA